MKPLPPLGLHPKKKSPEYLAYIRSKPCIICNSSEVVAHHEPPKKMGGGNSTDYHCVPLCARCHRARTIRSGISVDHRFISLPELIAMCQDARADLLVEYIQSRERYAFGRCAECLHFGLEVK